MVLKGVIRVATKDYPFFGIKKGEKHLQLSFGYRRKLTEDECILHDERVDCAGCGEDMGDSKGAMGMLTTHYINNHTGSHQKKIEE